ncbi:uncharacterized protein LOC134437209 [Engraulis encrasicolus]|uniref:uncharacterized protein LOC134437209 n=1 Tax=Engraulis encrasicolus TaxID=184585 RepID=UPI002FD25E3B
MDTLWVLLMYSSLCVCILGLVITQSPAHITALAGEELHLTCNYPRGRYGQGGYGEEKLVWMKQSSGERPVSIASIYYSKLFYEEEFAMTGRHKVEGDGRAGVFNLNISKAQPSDSSTYYCAVILHYGVVFAAGTVVDIREKQLYVTEQPDSLPSPSGGNGTHATDEEKKPPVTEHPDSPSPPSGDNWNHTPDEGKKSPVTEHPDSPLPPSGDNRTHTPDEGDGSWLIAVSSVAILLLAMSLMVNVALCLRIRKSYSLVGGSRQEPGWARAPVDFLLAPAEAPVLNSQ